MSTLSSAIVAVGPSMHTFHVMEHDGKKWLVPGWIDSPDGQWTRPERLILMDVLPYAALGGRADYVVNQILPRELVVGPLDAEVEAPYVVVYLPDIVLPLN